MNLRLMDHRLGDGVDFGVRDLRCGRGGLHRRRDVGRWRPHHGFRQGCDRGRGGGRRYLHRGVGAENIGDLRGQRPHGQFPVGEEVDPLAGGELVGEGVVGRDILDAQRHHGQLLLAGEGQLLVHFLGIVRVSGEDQQHELGLPDRPDDGDLEVFPREDVPAGNPALEATTLQSLTEGVGHLPVLRREADEDIGGHGRLDAHPARKTAAVKLEPRRGCKRELVLRPFRHWRRALRVAIGRTAIGRNRRVQQPAPVIYATGPASRPALRPGDGGRPRGV